MKRMRFLVCCIVLALLSAAAIAQSKRTTVNDVFQKALAVNEKINEELQKLQNRIGVYEDMGAMDRREVETALVGMRAKVNEIVAASGKKGRTAKNNAVAACNGALQVYNKLGEDARKLLGVVYWNVQDLGEGCNAIGGDSWGE